VRDDEDSLPREGMTAMRLKVLSAVFAKAKQSEHGKKNETAKSE